MIKDYILRRNETLVSDCSKEQKTLWKDEVVDFRLNGHLSPFTQEMFGLHRHTIFPTYLSAKTYLRASEFKLVFEAKMSNNDHIVATHSQIFNKIHRDRLQEEKGKLKILINGGELNHYGTWSTNSLSNFESLRNFYFLNWMPSQQANLI
jgi:hypothetical protein